MKPILQPEKVQKKHFKFQQDLIKNWSKLTYNNDMALEPLEDL